MREYRAYLIGRDGHIVHRVDILCVDDEAAKERARSVASQAARASSVSSGLSRVFKRVLTTVAVVGPKVAQLKS
jgi:hypothetical protein